MNKALQFEIKKEYDNILKVAGFSNLTKSQYLNYGYPDVNTTRIIESEHCTILFFLDDDDYFHLQTIFYRDDHSYIVSQCDINKIDLTTMKPIWLMEIVIGHLLVTTKKDFETKCKELGLNYTSY